MKASECIRRIKGLINARGDWVMETEEGDEIKDLLPNYSTGRITMMTAELKYQKDMRKRY